jgi:hypothetical protein
MASGTTDENAALTLFGNAPTPRQLFSSLPQKGESTTKIEEIGLPNGLTATQIMPIAADTKGPTFEETFPAPYSLSSIHPPKGHKRSVVRDTTLKWEFKDSSLSRGGKRGGYTTQSLTTADWLGYGGIDPAFGFHTPQEKRKRALSGGESLQTAQTKAQAEAELLKQEEALFRRAYSSFAPSTDNAKSLVPAHTKAMMWYDKIGDRRFNKVFGNDPALVSDTPPAEFALDPALMGPNTDNEDFGDVVKQLDSLPQEAFPHPSAENDKTNPDEVLRRISELLETLASHQRIRNAIIPSTTAPSRTPISPAPTLASKIGKPDAPAEDEVNTYTKLRHEIAYLVMKLPPYAVAKLDGDQLADLGVSKLLPFEARDYRGSMEEDEVAKIAKRTAAATAAATASLTRPTSSATGQHYSSSSRTPAIGQAANTRYQQYYAGQTRPAQPTTTYGSYGQNYAQGTPMQQRPGQPLQQFQQRSAMQTTYQRPQYGAQQPVAQPPNTNGHA